MAKSKSRRGTLARAIRYNQQSGIKKKADGAAHSAATGMYALGAGMAAIGGSPFLAVLATIKGLSSATAASNSYRKARQHRDRAARLDWLQAGLYGTQLGQRLDAGRKTRGGPAAYMNSGAATTARNATAKPSRNPRRQAAPAPVRNPGRISYTKVDGSTGTYSKAQVASFKARKR